MTCLPQSAKRDRGKPTKESPEEGQRKQYPEEGQCKGIDEKTHKKGLHNRETLSTILIFLNRHVSGVVAPLGNQGGHVGREGRIETDELPCAGMHEAKRLGVESLTRT